MKKTLLLKGLITVLAMSGSSVALAETGVRDARANLGSTTREARGDLKENLRAALLRVAQNRFEKIIKRFESTIQREENIMNRIISRMEKVKSNGGKTENAEKYIMEAKTHFDEAKVALTVLKNASSSPDILVDANMATSTKIKTALEKIKKMAKDVEKHIREGHKSLTQAVKALRGASSTSNATTTKSN